MTHDNASAYLARLQQIIDEAPDGVDVSAIAAGLEALFDSERRGEMSANAVQWASAHYHWPAVAEAWAGVAAAGGQLAGTVVVG